METTVAESLNSIDNSLSIIGFVIAVTGFALTLIFGAILNKMKG